MTSIGLGAVARVGKDKFWVSGLWNIILRLLVSRAVAGQVREERG